MDDDELREVFAALMERSARSPSMEALAEYAARVCRALGSRVWVVAGEGQPGEVVLDVVAWEVEPPTGLSLHVARELVGEVVPMGWVVSTRLRGGR